MRFSSDAQFARHLTQGHIPGGVAFPHALQQLLQRQGRLAGAGFAVDHADHAHRTEILCSKDEVQEAGLLRRLRAVWALYGPHTHDGPRLAMSAWNVCRDMRSQRSGTLRPAELLASAAMSDARILEGSVEELGLDPADYGTHSKRRTKATLCHSGVPDIAVTATCIPLVGDLQSTRRCGTGHSTTPSAAARCISVDSLDSLR